MKRPSAEESRISSSTCSSRAPARRSAEDIAQQIDSIGGQLDAFTAKEYASYYIKVLDEHLPLAIDILSDIVRNPAFSPTTSSARRRSCSKRSRWSRTRPTISSTSCSRRVLGEPSARAADSRHRRTVESFNAPLLRDYFGGVYTAQNLIVSAVGNSSTSRARAGAGEVRIARGRASRRRETPQVAARS
jgi:predicted Zn-dependent peptidase